jgi:3-hydroxyacyl-[acyl-carrier-protein] dehydratase
MTSPSSPLIADPEVIRRASADVPDPSSAAVVVVGAGEEVFAGHYPGFPIFPGVCLVECAHRSSIATAPVSTRSLRLAAIESVRFLSPAFPGDRVYVEIDWKRADDTWRCTGRVSTERGTAAQIRLRYQTGEDS